MEKSTKILIGVGVIGIIGLLVYKVKATPSVTNTGNLPKKPIIKPSTPTNPIIDPETGKLTPVTPKDNITIDPSTNPQFDMSKGIGLPSGGGGGGGIPSGGGGGGAAVNNPDSNSGKFAKVDPNKKDENWIKALEKKQKAGNQKGKKPSPKVDCSVNPYDPTCQKVKDCYYNPTPDCSGGKYDYSYDYANDTYSGYDNNTYDYNYDNGGYDYSGGGYYGADYQGGYYGGGYFYSGNYGYGYSYGSGGGTGGSSGGRGGNPSDYYY